MSHLEEAGIVDIKWTEDEECIYADGLQSYEYEVETKELAVFNGPKCIKIHTDIDTYQMYSIVISGEAVCMWRKKSGEALGGKTVNERGWAV